MEQEIRSDQANWLTYRKPVRADYILNKQMLSILLKLFLSFSVLCAITTIFPEAKESQSFAPSIWNKTDELDVRKISPLNRKIKFFVLPNNTEDKMDQIIEAQTFSLRDQQESNLRWNVKLNNLRDFEVLEGSQLKYYLGDLHVLDEVAFRMKILKPEKKQNRLLQESGEETEHQNIELNTTGKQSIGNEDEVSGLDQSETGKQEVPENEADENAEGSTNTDQPIKNQTIKIQTNQTATEQQTVSNQTEQTGNETALDNKTSGNETEPVQTEQQMQERMKKEAEEEERREKEEREQKEKEKRRQQEERRKKSEYEKTNIRMEAYYMSNFATIMELVVKYISILVIIYMGTDNPSAPLGIAIICALFSNPLLFIQVSFPNDVGNVIDCFCLSAPFLYPSLWMYYIHHKIKYDDEKDGPVFLIAKMAPCLFLYFLEVLRLMHFDVVVWETVMGVCVWGILSWYLWEAFLNIKYQHHRDKLIFSVSFTFLAFVIVFNRLSHSWNFLLNYIVIQSYGLFLIYLMGSKKDKKQRKQNKEDKHRDHKSSEMLAQYETNLEEENEEMGEQIRSNN